jgi:hypothetical protein
MSLLSQINAAVGGSPTGPTGPAYAPVAILDNPPPPLLPLPPDSPNKHNPRYIARKLQQQQFLRHFARVLDIREAVKLTKIPLSTFDRWYHEPEFIAAYAVARQGLIEITVDDIELKAMNMALRGDTSMIKTVLQAYKPELYKQRETKVIQNNNNGSGEQKIYLGDFSGTRDELIGKIRERNAEIQRKKIENENNVIEAETTKTTIPPPTTSPTEK